MLRKFWLIFAQGCTVCLALLFVVTTLRPDILSPMRSSGGTDVVVVKQAQAPTQTTGAPKLHAAWRDAAKRAMPAVVNIYTSKEVSNARNPMLEDPILRRFFGIDPNREARRQVSLGSGVIVSSRGDVLTNNHVIEGADDIELVLSDGRHLQAKVRGADPESDLAVLQADGHDLPAITFGNLERVEVGDVVLAIGNPFGFGNTVTMGIVSALGRNHLGINRFEDFIQTDAAINPGNSGGALIDAEGNLIGVNSTIYSQSGGSQGIGFAIPVTIARNVLEQILKTGEVTRGWLGIEPQDLIPQTATAGAVNDAQGVLIRNVLRNGPADRAGLLPRDVVVEIDGKSTPDSIALLARIASLRPGSQAHLKLLRDKKPLELDVTIGKRPRPDEARP